MYPVNSLKQAHEMLLVDPQLSDRDSDLDDGELLDVRTAAKYQCRHMEKVPTLQRMYGRMPRSKRTPGASAAAHGVDSRRHYPREWEELAAAIYEYRDVFSSGPADMG